VFRHSQDVRRTQSTIGNNLQGKFSRLHQPGDSVLLFGIEGIQDVCRHPGESLLDLLGHLFSTVQDHDTLRAVG
jgi:hypothetical protein